MKYYKLTTKRYEDDGFLKGYSYCGMEDVKSTIGNTVMLFERNNKIFVLLSEIEVNKELTKESNKLEEKHLPLSTDEKINKIKEELNGLYGLGGFYHPGDIKLTYALNIIEEYYPTEEEK